MKKIIMSVCLLLIGVLSFNGIEIITSELELIEARDLSDDTIISGQKIDFNGSGDDLALFGNNLTINGNLRGSLVAFGDTVIVSGTVNNNLLAIGKSVTIKGNILSTTIIMADSVFIDKTAVIGGELIVMAREVIIEGTLKRDLKFGAGRMVISGIVNGNVRGETGTLIIGDNATIKGNLNYRSEAEISPAESERVTGEILHLSRTKPIDSKKILSGIFPFIFAIKILLFLTFLIIGIMLLLLPVTKKLDRSIDKNSILKMFLYGIPTVLIYPLIVLFLIVSVFGIFFGLFLALLTIPLGIVLQIFGSIFAGMLIKELFKLKIESRFIYFIIGALILFFFSLIPFIALLVNLAYWFLGAGYLLYLLLNKQTNIPPPETVIENKE